MNPAATVHCGGSLDENLAYFAAHEASILREAAGRDVVVIADCEVRGYFVTRSEALRFAAENFDPGYLVRKMSDAERHLVASNFGVRV